MVRDAAGDSLVGSERGVQDNWIDNAGDALRSVTDAELVAFTEAEFVDLDLWSVQVEADYCDESTTSGSPGGGVSPPGSAGRDARVVGVVPAAPVPAGARR